MATLPLLTAHPVHDDDGDPLAWTTSGPGSPGGYQKLGSLWKRASRWPLWCRPEIRIDSTHLSDFRRTYVTVYLNPTVHPRTPFLRPHLLHVTLLMTNNIMDDELVAELSGSLRAVLINLLAGAETCYVSLCRDPGGSKTWNFALEPDSEHLFVCLRAAALVVIKRMAPATPMAADRPLHVSWL